MPTCLTYYSASVPWNTATRAIKCIAEKKKQEDSTKAAKEVELATKCNDGTGSRCSLEGHPWKVNSPGNGLSPSLNTWGQCCRVFAKNGFVTPRITDGLHGSLAAYVLPLLRYLKLNAKKWQTRDPDYVPCLANDVLGRNYLTIRCVVRGCRKHTSFPIMLATCQLWESRPNLLPWVAICLYDSLFFCCGEEGEQQHQDSKLKLGTVLTAMRLTLLKLSLVQLYKYVRLEPILCFDFSICSLTQVSELCSLCSLH